MSKAPKLLQAIMFLATAVVTTQSSIEERGWNLIWSDEFDGESLDFSKWSIMEGDGCQYGVCRWGNNELELYTSDAISVSNGELGISVSFNNGTYSSGRIRSLGLAEFTYGRIESRLKLLQGDGLWPAFWMLPSEDVYGGWAASGEIDIMEAVNDMSGVLGTLHFGGSWPDNTNSGWWPNLNLLACAGGSWCTARLPDSSSFANQYRIFALEWEHNEIRWYIDDFMFCRKHLWYGGGLKDSFPAPFNQNFHILLNVAVGGWLANSISPDPMILPLAMKVDYIRWYQREYENVIAPTCSYSDFDGSFFPGFSRSLLLIIIPFTSLLLIALTGLNGLFILSGGWTVCEIMQGQYGGGCLGVESTELVGTSAREAILLGAALTVPLGVIQALYSSRSYLQSIETNVAGFRRIFYTHIGGILSYSISLLVSQWYGGMQRNSYIIIPPSYLPSLLALISSIVCLYLFVFKKVLTWSCTLWEKYKSNSVFFIGVLGVGGMVSGGLEGWCGAGIGISLLYAGCLGYPMWRSIGALGVATSMLFRGLYIWDAGPGGSVVTHLIPFMLAFGGSILGLITGNTLVGQGFLTGWVPWSISSSYGLAVSIPAVIFPVYGQNAFLSLIISYAVFTISVICFYFFQKIARKNLRVEKPILKDEVETQLIRG